MWFGPKAMRVKAGACLPRPSGSTQQKDGTSLFIQEETWSMSCDGSGEQ